MAKRPKTYLNSVIQVLTTNRLLQLLLICLLVIATYYHTLDVPFYYDDNSSLRNNPAIQGIHFDRLWGQYSARFIGYFTFAVNYSIHGYEVGGYHLINIFIHLINCCLFFLMASLFMSTPVLTRKTSDNVKTWLPFVAAFLFALHPLQIQAITYIVQRLASLAAFFYLASVTCYLAFRLAEKNLYRLAYAILAIMTFFLGFLTKQNVITVPLVWILAEIICFPLSKTKVHVSAVLAVVAISAGYFLAPFLVGQPLLEFMDSQTRETTLFTRLEYFSVQMHVLLNYIIKFVIPLNLTLNYEYIIPTSFFEIKTLLKAAFHSILIIFAVAAVRKYPIASFGLLFYYISHLVESSIIPIRDFGFDHRTYIPNAGLCLSTGWAYITLSDQFFSRYKIQTAVILVLFLAAITWQRNDKWRNPTDFFEHEARVLESSFRVHCLLGQAYYEEGNTFAALETYRLAWPLRENDINRGNNTFESCASNFTATLQEQGFLEEAETLIEELQVNGFSAQAQSKIFNTMGNIYALQDRYEEAEEYFERSRQIYSRNIDPVSNLAKLKILSGDFPESYELFQLVNQMDPGNSDAAIGLEYLESILNQN